MATQHIKKYKDIFIKKTIAANLTMLSFYFVKIKIQQIRQYYQS